MMTHRDDTQTQADNLRFIRTAMKMPLLERDHEAALASAWREKNDEKALHKLINAHARLVVAVAAKFRGYGLPIGDLIQEGHIGLLQAANRFEVEREVRFSTYATWWIRASIQDYVLRNWSIVRSGTTATQKSLFFNLRRLRARIEGKARREGHLEGVHLTDDIQEEIARALRVNSKDVAWMSMRLSSSDQSLHQTMRDDSNTEIGEFLVDDKPGPEEQVMARLDGSVQHQWLDESLGQLDKREQAIIRNRHLKESGATLEELGTKLKISKERVRQLETRAMEKLKKLMQAKANDEGSGRTA